MGGCVSLLEPLVALHTVGTSFFQLAQTLLVYNRTLELSGGLSDNDTDAAHDQAQTLSMRFFLLQNIIITVCALLSMVPTTRLAVLYGERARLLCPLLGSLLGMGALLAVLLLRLPLEVLYAGAALHGLSGGSPGFWSAVVALASLQSDRGRRTLKINTVDFCAGAAGVLGGLLSGYVYRLGVGGQAGQGEQSGVVLVATAMALVATSILYSTFLLSYPQHHPPPLRKQTDNPHHPPSSSPPQKVDNPRQALLPKHPPSPPPSPQKVDNPRQALLPKHPPSPPPPPQKVDNPRQALLPKHPPSPPPQHADNNSHQPPLLLLHRQSPGRHPSSSPRAAVVLVALALVLYAVGMHGAESTLTLYVLKPPLSWDSVWAGYGSAATHAMYLSSFLGVLLLSPLLDDTALVLLGVVSNCTGMAIMAFATRSWLYFMARAVMMFSCVPMPTLKAQLSKILDAQQYGCVFGWLQLALSVSNVMSTAVFTLLYPLSLAGGNTGLCFLLSSAVSYSSVIPVLYLNSRSIRHPYVPLWGDE
ncbi:solute carrier family 46 member 2 [Engraulis encrasicolus]|uniref:solute carrier family 46 member 2 n=1 Tax=Engraulis encrasicolus TaxID=184585 RepID=UPI002FD6ADC3